MGGLLQNLDVHRLMGHHLVQPAVLLLPRLFGHQGVHLAVLRPPAIGRLLADAHMLADLRHRQSLAQVHVRQTQLGHDLLGTVSLLQERNRAWPFGRQNSLTILDHISSRGSIMSFAARLGC